MVRQAPVTCVMAPPIHPRIWSMSIPIPNPFSKSHECSASAMIHHKQPYFICSFSHLYTSCLSPPPVISSLYTNHVSQHHYLQIPDRAIIHQYSLLHSKSRTKQDCITQMNPLFIIQHKYLLSNSHAVFIVSLPDILCFTNFSCPHVLCYNAHKVLRNLFYAKPTILYSVTCNQDEEKMKGFICTAICNIVLE